MPATYADSHGVAGHGGPLTGGIPRITPDNPGLATSEPAPAPATREVLVGTGGVGG